MSAADARERPSSVPSQELVARVAALRVEIAEHNRRYNIEDAPTIADADYDDLIRELRAMEEQYPELVVEGSPTGVVGAPPSATFDPVRHRVPMMSLDNAFSPDELVAWGERVERRLARVVQGELVDQVETVETVGFCCELKIDGVAIS